jgi:hypothetical protein
MLWFSGCLCGVLWLNSFRGLRGLAGNSRIASGKTNIEDSCGLQKLKETSTSANQAIVTFWARMSLSRNIRAIGLSRGLLTIT